MEYSEALRKGYVPGTGGDAGIYGKVLQSYNQADAKKQAELARANPQRQRDIDAASQKRQMNAQVPRVSGLSMDPWGGKMIRNVPTAPNPANEFISRISSDQSRGSQGSYKGFVVPEFQKGAAGKDEQQAYMQYFVDLLASKGYSPVGYGGMPHEDLQALSEKAGYKMQPMDYMPSWEKNILAEKQAAADMQASMRQQNMQRFNEQRMNMGLPPLAVGAYAAPQVQTDALKEAKRLAEPPKPGDKQAAENMRARMVQDAERARKQNVRKHELAKRNASSTGRRVQGEPWKGYNKAYEEMHGRAAAERAGLR